MSRLFVDCDDTLVIWQPENRKRADGLYMGDEWGSNDPLIDAIKAYLANNTDTQLIIWSGGGLNYADLWGRRILNQAGVHGWIALSKDNRLPRDGDLCIDDIELTLSSGEVVHPDYFIEVFLAGREISG